MYFLEELSRRINKNPHRSPEEGDYYFERINPLAVGENPQSCGPLAAWGLQWFIIQPEWVLDDNYNEISLYKVLRNNKKILHRNDREDVLFLELCELNYKEYQSNTKLSTARDRLKGFPTFLIFSNQWITDGPTTIDFSDSANLHNSIDKFVNLSLANANLRFFFGCWKHTKIDFPDDLSCEFGEYYRKNSFSGFCEHALDEIYNYNIIKIKNRRYSFDFSGHKLLDMLFFRKRKYNLKSLDPNINSHYGDRENLHTDESNVSDYESGQRMLDYIHHSKLIKRLITIFLLEQLYKLKNLEWG